MDRLCRALAASVVVAAMTSPAPAGDWPQYMRGAERTGDAADETLRLPLRLVAQVQLDDLVTTSPAVVSGKAYVVDQMGAAYCVDLKTARVLWKSSPDGDRAMGGNTSSPCVAAGRVFYGTTAGNFHVLDARDGKPVKTIRLAWPVVAAPVFANDSVYFQTVGAEVVSIDPAGNERWRWDYYKQVTPPVSKDLASFHPQSQDVPHYSMGELCASGKKIVVSCGWDLYCLEDRGTEAALAWCDRAPVLPCSDGSVPLGVSISGDSVFVAAPGVEWSGSLLRVSLKDGSHDGMDYARHRAGEEWRKNKNRDAILPKEYNLFSICGTPAVRGSTVFYARSKCGFGSWEYTGKEEGPEKIFWRRNWESWHWAYAARWQASVTSPALSKEHCVVTTVDGELIVAAQDFNASWEKGDDLTTFKPAPFRFKLPGGKMIASSPAVADAQVVFGSDDGCLYVFGPEGKAEPRESALKLYEPKSAVAPATGKTYGWPYPTGDFANTSAVEDAGLKPPYRLRWACRPLGSFRAPPTASLNDVFFSTMDGTVIAMEQMTGRIRWRRRIGVTGEGASVPTVWKDRLYLIGAGYDPRTGGRLRSLMALDARTGETIWTQPLGGIIGGVDCNSRSSPVVVNGLVVVSFITRKGYTPVIEAFDADKGAPAWKVMPSGEASITDTQYTCAIGGCLADGVLYYTWALKDNVGATLAIDPKDGSTLWKSDAYGINSVSAKDGRLYLIGYGVPMTCLLAKDGSVVWQQKVDGCRHLSVGKDCLIARGYAGRGPVFSIADGSPLMRDGRRVWAGGPSHACCPVRVVLPNLAFGITSGGLIVQDLDTGKALWTSRGLGARTCCPPAFANGRIFVDAQTSLLFCFEPEAARAN